MGQVGAIAAGNIDLYNRPKVPNPRGGTSTVYSASFNIDGKEVLLPLSDDGRILSEDEAIEKYQRTGKHLGIFATPAAATSYAQQLHKDYEAGKYERPMAQSEVVIRGADGIEHVFPAGFDPKRASEIVKKRAAPTPPPSQAPPPELDQFGLPVLMGARGRATMNTPLARPTGIEAVDSMTSPANLLVAGGIASTSAARLFARGAVALADVVSPEVAGILSPRLGNILKMVQRYKTATAKAPVPAPGAAPRHVGKAPTLEDSLISAVDDVRATPAPSSAGTLPPATTQTAAGKPAVTRAQYDAMQGRPTPVAQPPAPAPAPVKPAAPPAAPMQQVKAVAAANKITLSAPETAAGLALVKRGKTAEEALGAVLAQREFLKRFSGLPTPREVAAAVSERNATGRW